MYGKQYGIQFTMEEITPKTPRKIVNYLGCEQEHFNAGGICLLNIFDLPDWRVVNEDRVSARRDEHQPRRIKLYGAAVGGKCC